MARTWSCGSKDDGEKHLFRFHKYILWVLLSGSVLCKCTTELARDLAYSIGMLDMFRVFPFISCTIRSVYGYI